MYNLLPENLGAFVFGPYQKIHIPSAVTLSIWSPSCHSLAEISEEIFLSHFDRQNFEQIKHHKHKANETVTTVLTQNFLTMQSSPTSGSNSTALSVSAQTYQSGYLIVSPCACVSEAIIHTQHATLPELNMGTCEALHFMYG
jgi:hypothetical protein